MTRHHQARRQARFAGAVRLAEHVLEDVACARRGPSRACAAAAPSSCTRPRSRSDPRSTRPARWRAATDASELGIALLHRARAVPRRARSGSSASSDAARLRVPAPVRELPRMKRAHRRAGISALSLRGGARYSSLPASRPRSPTTTRCGMPMQLRVRELDARALVAIVVAARRCRRRCSSA